MTKRNGFTLVEMLVAMALTLFVMTILSQCFISGLETFSQLKAIGDMEENLRVATMNLRSDLQLDHFEAKRRLSDPTFGTPPLREGFFVITQGGASVSEGVDDDAGLPSYRAANDTLNFAIKMRGNRRENFLAAVAPASATDPLGQQTNFFGQPSDAFYQDTGTYNSPWAEVAYFLVLQGGTVNPHNSAAGGTPLYSLYRSQFLVAPSTSAANAFAANVANKPQVLADYNSGKYANIACKLESGNVVFYSPNDLTTKRTYDATNQMRGATLVLTNVVSFDIQIMKPGSSGVTPDVNSDFADLNPGGAGSYDSSTATYRIMAIQISIRIWDQKSQQSRQITIVQDM